MATIGTTRLTLKTALTTPASGTKFFTDHEDDGVKQLDWDDLCTALQAELGNNMTIEEVADSTALAALTVLAAEVGKRLARQADTGVVYLAAATGSGADKWVQYRVDTAATTSAAGVVELTTEAEALAGTDTTRAVTAIAAKAVADRIMAAMLGADYLQSDGATTNRRIETVYGALGAVAGSDLTEVDYAFDVPTSNPASIAVIFAFSSANNAQPALTAWSLSGFIYTDGSLIFECRGATPATDSRQFTYSGFRAAYSGRRVRLTVAFTGASSTAPVVYLDGVDISSLFTATDGAGTDPDWVSASLNTTYHLAGYNWPAGYFRPGRPVNRKYAQADVTFVQQTGRLPYADAAGGSAEALYTSDFSAGVDSWIADTGRSVTGNIDSINGSDDWLEIKATAGPVYLSGLSGVVLSSADLGRKIRVTLTIFNPAGSGITHFSIGESVGTVAAGTIAVVALAEGNELTTTIEYLKMHTSSHRLIIEACDSGGTHVALATDKLFYVKAVSMKRLGALSDPVIQPILALGDATPNGKGSLVVGFSPVTQKRDWVIQGSTASDAAGGAQLLGGALFADYTRHMIDTLETNGSSTATVSIGSATGALTTYKASAAINSGRNRHTLVTPILATANIWVSSSTTDTLKHVIRGHLVD